MRWSESNYQLLRCTRVPGDGDPQASQLNSPRGRKRRGARGGLAPCCTYRIQAGSARIPISDHNAIPACIADGDLPDDQTSDDVALPLVDVRCNSDGRVLLHAV
jgi:hypothetical protein